MTLPIFSRAGAAGRIALVEAGATLLGAPVNQCVAFNGARVAGDQSVTHAEIVRRGELSHRFTAEDLTKLPIMLGAERCLTGRSADAIDIPAKTKGATRYGIDASVEGLVYARSTIPPSRNGSRVLSVNDHAARMVEGYICSLALEDPMPLLGRPHRARAGRRRQRRRDH
jgi:hypothetical protein